MANGLENYNSVDAGPNWGAAASGTNYLGSTFDFGNFSPDSNTNTGFNMGSDFGNFGSWGNSDSGFNSLSGDGPNMLGDFSNWGGDFNSLPEGSPSFVNPDYGNFSNYNMEQDSELAKFAKNPVVSFLMGMHPVTAGANALMRGPTATGGFLGSLIGSGAGPIGSFLGRGIGQGLGSALSGKDVTASSFLPTAGQTGSFLGSMFGGAIGGQPGSMLGSMLGGRVGNAAGSATGATPGINPSLNSAGTGTESVNMSGNMFPSVGGVVNDSALGLLPSILATGAAQKAAKGQINNLQQLFAPNSAYAQEMRQQLERRDAAAGRRSQYGNREVELQAKLATLAAAQAPQIQKLYDQRNANRNMLINTALRNPGVQKLMSQGIDGLAGMFSQRETPSLGGTTFNPDLGNMPNYLEPIPWGDLGGGW